MPDVNSYQVAGNHYNGGKLQHWDYTIAVLNNRYLEGSITKYVSRHRKKNGMQDLEKAKHFLEKLRESFFRGMVQPIGFPTNAQTQIIDEFVTVSGLNPEEAWISRRCASWTGAHDLSRIGHTIEELMRRQRKADRDLEATKAGAAPLGIGTALAMDEAEVAREYADDGVKGWPGEEPGPGYTKQDHEE